ncbi:MAG: hypothetical protein ACON4Z_10440, partial [Planctomycetota bacterium]
ERLPSTSARSTAASSAKPNSTASAAAGLVPIEGAAVSGLPCRVSAEAHARYAELIREWQERGERPADCAPIPEQATVLLGDLLQQFLHHVDATGRYRKNGEPTAQRAEFVNVINSLTAFAGKLPVARMTEATLVAWRDVLERNRALTRTGINRKVGKSCRSSGGGAPVDYYVAIAATYSPQPYPGSADLFYSQQANRALRYFWRATIRGGVRFHPLRGEHLEIIQSPELLAELAESMTRVLKRTQS